MSSKSRTRVRIAAAVVGTLALTAGVSACGGATTVKKGANGLPTVTMMVGGIDKQIYLPYELAQGLGYYKKYGVNMQLSTETAGGVGAEDAMASGQVDMAGAWYIHTIDFQQKGKDVVSVAQLSGAPGERIMCNPKSGVKTPADFKGKSIGVTDLGSGTDDLVRFLASKTGLTTKDFHRVGVGEGSTLLSQLQQNRVACAITTQPTVNAVEKAGAGVPTIDLATTAGVNKWLGGPLPSAAVLTRADWVKANPDATQKVVDALVATMHYIATHSAADIAAHLPASYVENGLTTKADYIKTLTEDKGQFLPDGMMPANGPQTVLNEDKAAGNVSGSVDLSKTYTNQYVIAAHKKLGY
ncbi:ABC transporter substrate-binding protein [Phaeacidiphilus oryzae]|uniref:ABC transporter substrate-binding protein n=1 Tax=Phaeacidiphilus oryzae TaxID=348818 RepID=UPI00069120F4|nr:ABC transporter substrate-binding protein [Phaeacidiphilus oryzae]